MTKKQREQVVELLRCAADRHPIGYGLNGMYSVPGVPESVRAAAWEVLNSFSWPTTEGFNSDRADEGYRTALLEAAARVEEGSWPGADQ